MALSDMKIRKAEIRDKPYKLTDGGGLFVLVKPNGSKLWQQKYRHFGKERLLSHGQYPEVTLARNGRAPTGLRREVARWLRLRRRRVWSCQSNLSFALIRSCMCRRVADANKGPRNLVGLCGQCGTPNFEHTFGISFSSPLSHRCLPNSPEAALRVGPKAPAPYQSGHHARPALPPWYRSRFLAARARR